MADADISFQHVQRKVHTIKQARNKKKKKLTFVNIRASEVSGKTPKISVHFKNVYSSLLPL